MGAAGEGPPGRDDLVAVIVLNRNGRDLLLACLGAVARLHGVRVEAVVVDNGSSDGSAAAVAQHFPRVHLLAQAHNLGVAGGRNAGLAWALAHLDPAYLLFIDNDTLLEQGSAARLVARAAGDPQVGLVAPKAYRTPGDLTLVSAGGMGFNPYLGAAWDVGAGETDRGQRDRAGEIQACPGFAFFVRRAVFQRVGPFDEGFNPYGWEDVEFSLRAARAGFRLMYEPSAVVHHKGGRAGRGPIAAYEREKVRKMFRLVRLHSSPVQLACFALLLPFRAVARAGSEIARGNGAVVIAWLAGLIGARRR